MLRPCVATMPPWMIDDPQAPPPGVFVLTLARAAVRVLIDRTRPNTYLSNVLMNVARHIENAIDEFTRYHAGHVEVDMRAPADLGGDGGGDGGAHGGGGSGKGPGRKRRRMQEP